MLNIRYKSCCQFVYTTTRKRFVIFTSRYLTINEFGFRIIWRIMEIEEGVSCRGRRITYSALLGLFSSANILQIADVTLRVVLLLFFPCFYLLFRLALTLDTSEMSAIFVFTNKTTQPRPQVFSVNGALTCKEAALLTSLVDWSQNSSKFGHQ